MMTDTDQTDGHVDAELNALSDPRIYYVYAWLRTNGEPFYIGKGKGRRDSQPKKSQHFRNIVRKMRDAGHTPAVVRLRDELTESEAFELERSEIKMFGRIEFGGLLCNLTDGGDGSSGAVRNAEARARISIVHSGKTITAEHRARITLALSGRIPSQNERAAMSTAQHMMGPRSGFKGVRLDSRRGTYRAEIRINGGRIHAGSFKAAEEAARAYDELASAAWGSRCYLNFPNEVLQ